METLTSGRTPLPASERHDPQRIRSLNCRFYVDRFQEHRQALDYYDEECEFWGDKSALIVHALRTYAEDLAQGQARRYTVSKVPREERAESQRSVPRQWRVYIDKYAEHRRAYELYQQAKGVHGQTKHLIVAALLNLRDRDLAAQQLAA